MNLAKAALYLEYIAFLLRKEQGSRDGTVPKKDAEPTWWVYTSEKAPDGLIAWIHAADEEVALTKARLAFPEYAPESISVRANKKEKPKRG